MKIEFLGTGGAFTTPRPGADNRVSNEARQKGVPYSRSGPSVYVHGAEVLIDTPEEIKDQLNRSTVKQVPACLYSHWHPDHTMGRRVWETLNWNWRLVKNDAPHTDIYLPQQVAADFKKRLGLQEHFEYMQKLGFVKMITVPDGDTLTLNGWKITPFRLYEDYVYAFLFEQADKRVLIAMDELFGWIPPDFVKGVDLAILPMGIVDIHPLDGRVMIPPEHPVLQSEATFEQTLDMVRQLNAKRVIMAHIEEGMELSYDDLLVLAGNLREDGFNITFAYDTMMVEV